MAWKGLVKDPHVNGYKRIKQHELLAKVQEKKYLGNPRVKTAWVPCEHGQVRKGS